MLFSAVNHIIINWLLLLILHEINRIHVSCIEINSFEQPDCHKHLYECEENIFEKAHKYFKHKKVLFIGDAFTRYQYLSLCFILRHRQPESKHAYPRIIQENSWNMNDLNLNKRESFYIGSSAVLHPYETCIKCKKDGSFESRYYHDIKLKVTLAYIQYNGIGDVFHDKKDEIKSYFPDLNRIDVVVTNIGFLSYNSSIKVEEYIQFIKSLGTIIVWLTTPYQNGEYNDAHWWKRHHNTTINRTQMNAVDYQMCNCPGVLCLDTSWTAKYVHANSYWNNLFFTEPTYAIFNDQLIDLVTKQTRH